MKHRFWKIISSFASAEFFLEKTGANGSDIIIARSFFVTLWIGIVVFFRWFILNGSFCTDNFSLTSTLTWLALLFGAVYTSLYVKFSSQWSYLATLYNQIKQVEIQIHSNEKISESALKLLSEWKAGYIEDAFTLHLYAKKNVAIVIYHWGNSTDVKKAFLESSCYGITGWEKIRIAATKSIAD